MKRVPLLFLILAACLSMSPAWGAAADAREVARLNNCNPKKIEVFSQKLGADSQTLYRVDCTMPKMASNSEKQGPEALLIQCDGSLCDLVRPIGKDEK